MKMHLNECPSFKNPSSEHWICEGAILQSLLSRKFRVMKNTTMTSFEKNSVVLETTYLFILISCYSLWSSWHGICNNHLNANILKIVVANVHSCYHWLRPGIGKCWLKTITLRTNEAAEIRQITPAGMIFLDLFHRKYITPANVNAAPVEISSKVNCLFLKPSELNRCHLPSWNNGFGGVCEFKYAPYPKYTKENCKI